ncbi:MAG: hypothetical protein K2Y18_05765 [Alphaproteobacteria bacterium]|jgi:hypothetical protein|nr:hypothetical protein [Alphaproteobacteria bacterium]
MATTRWAFIDCGKFPSDDNCKIKLSAPAEQVDRLVDLATYHASKNHGHENTQSLKEMIKSAVVYEEVLSEERIQETDF